MDVEFRPLRPEDLEQAVNVEAVAFYNEPRPGSLELLRRILPLTWTVGAFVDGQLVADVRTTPMARRINGGSTGFGAVGPVTCLAEHRRHGYAGQLLRLSLEWMRENGLPLSGLYTPHDGLYQRYGWERAEGKRRYVFQAKDLSLRVEGEPGRLRPVGVDDWQLLDAVYRRYAAPRNGPLDRPELWWRHAVLQNIFEDRPMQAFLWLDARDDAQGFVIYAPREVRAPRGGRETELVVRDIVAVTPGAYLGIWQHLLNHDIARPIIVHAPLDDPFPELVVDGWPWKLEVQRAEGAMVRVVDVEHALATRPYCGDRPVSFSMRIIDAGAPWNDGVWRVEAAEGHMKAERTAGEADLELSVNFLSPLFTGFVRPDVAAGAGMIRVSNEAALEQVVAAFATTYPPYCNDFY